MDGNGEIIQTPDRDHGNKESAEAHSKPGTSSRSTQDKKRWLTGRATEDPAVDEMSAMLEGLGKKKKKSSKKDKSADADAAEDAAAADGDEAFDATMLKKKKKSKKPKTDDDFAAKLAEAGVVDDAADKDAETAAAAAKPGSSQEGNLELGTGIWQHSCTTPIEYGPLLSRFFSQLHSNHPDLASMGSKSYKIPPPQCLREGNKKTIFANIAEICKRMKRTDEHVTQFLFAELGTSGSVDGSRRLVIKGRFQQKQIENVLRRYIGTLGLVNFTR